MVDHFIIDMLPAREGDCLWIEYGDSAKPHRIIVDGGRQIAYSTLADRFAALPLDQREFELLVCTHVDADHIEGLLKLVKDPALAVSFKDVWFNGFDHLKKPDGFENFGAKQGEHLTDGIIDRQWNWNKAFNNGSVVVPDEGELPGIALPGGMEITLLSPTWDKLEKLRPSWIKQCEKAGLIPGVDPEPLVSSDIEHFGALNIEEVGNLAKAPFKKDRSHANGTSVAFVASFGGRSVLLAGDAHADIVSSNLARMNDGNPVPVDAFKLSHHGSKGTLSDELLEKIDCRKFLVSTDGSRHNHPDREAIARVVTSRAEDVEIIGNFSQANILEWDIAALRNHFSFAISTSNTGIMRTKLI
ncbi:MAG: hypothetical protein GY761_17900 [Hyphomicrobiales bacterium]|nr:hypothetical protein [Hyphomicrobiales bacterium]